MDKRELDSYYERWKDRKLVLGPKGPSYKNPGQDRLLPFRFNEAMEYLSLVISGRIEL